MRIEFDPAKDKLNLAAHGLSLALAESFAWQEAMVWVDDRFEYDEVRMVGLVPAGIACTTWRSSIARTSDESSAFDLRSVER